MTNPQTVRQGIHDGDLTDAGHLPLEKLVTVQTDTSLVAHPDGAGGVAFVAEASGSGIYVNVVAYGATGDGTTDDTAAIQAAIDAFKETGATLFFPRGTYKITGQLNVNPSGSATGSLAFLGEGSSGEGPDSIINQVTANTPGFVCTTNAYIVSFDKLDIRGPVGGSSGAGIKTIRNLEVTDCRVAGFFQGIRIGASAFYSQIQTTLIYNNASVGIWQENASNNLTVLDCHVEANGIGIKLDGAKSTRIIGGTVEGNTSHGISVDTVGTQVMDGAVIFGVYFENNGSASIKLGDTAQVRGTWIGGCFFTSTQAGYFIDAEASDYLWMTGNTFLGTPASGDIRLQSGVTHTYIIPGRPSGVGNTFTATPVILDGTLSGAAGGDLSGTYPNPTVAKVNGVAVTGTPSTGQVPTATGTAAATWQTPASGFTAGGDLTGTSTSQTVAKINGSPLGSLSPAAADRLRWNGSAWVNSSLIWAPVMVLDPGTGNYLVLTDTSGNPIMAEV